MAILKHSGTKIIHTRDDNQVVICWREEDSEEGYMYWNSKEKGREISPFEVYGPNWEKIENKKENIENKKAEAKIHRSEEDMELYGKLLALGFKKIMRLYDFPGMKNMKFSDITRHIISNQIKPTPVKKPIPK